MIKGFLANECQLASLESEIRKSVKDRLDIAKNETYFTHSFVQAKGQFYTTTPLSFFLYRVKPNFN